jgi:hypothetical protein
MSYTFLCVISHLSICVRKCFTEFSNLDGFATGTAGAAGGNGGDGGSPTGAMITKTVLSTVAAFDPDQATAWRSLNFALQKSLEVLAHVQAGAEKHYDLCMSLCDFGISNICPTCTVPTVLGFITGNVAFALTLAVDISEHTYGEIVDGHYGDSASEKAAAAYENVITIHRNILTSNSVLKNVLDIVTGVKTKVGARRRLEVIDCTNTTLGYVDNCRKPSCENPTRFCDGSFNYEYISQLKGGENHNRTM